MKTDLDPTQVEGAADSPYEVPNVLVDYHMAPAGVPVLWWRSVGHSFTAFAKEGFIDELAHAAGADPYRYRRQLLASIHASRQSLTWLQKSRVGVSHLCLGDIGESQSTSPLEVLLPRLQRFL